MPTRSAFPLLLALLLAPPPGSAAISATRAEPLQDEQELPDKRPEVAELIERLGKHVKKRGDEDTQAIAVIAELSQEFPGSGPKDRSAIVKGLDKCMAAKRKELEEDVPDNRLHLAAAEALGAMGPESVDTLIDWIDHKKHRADLTLQRGLILALGRTGDGEAIEPLLDLLPHKDALLQAAAAEALGGFAGRPQEVRKEIFEGLLKQLMSVRNQAQDINDTIARERYDVIAAPIMTSLQRLSGQDIWQPNEWQRWWNKNKKGDWETEGES